MMRLCAEAWSAACLVRGSRTRRWETIRGIYTRVPENGLSMGKTAQEVRQELGKSRRKRLKKGKKVWRESGRRSYENESGHGARSEPPQQ
jgi:hypothetical protein